MNLSELQAALRHFAAERDWQPFHTPKNLSTALMVEAAELAEIFQWLTPEQSLAANLDAERRARVADEVADVLMYLLQTADHCEVDLAQAAAHKLARNALKYPAVRSIPRVSSANAAVPGVHVLLDYENVQPSEDELRALVPDAGQVWVFHGPHQRQVEKHFAGFGASVTAVPISKTGKNALDFHLSFYMGYIASRNPSATLVVVANDKGYEPMLEHARAMGFAARQLGHGPARAKSKVAKTTSAQPPVQAAKTSAPTASSKKAGAKKASAKPASAKQTTAKRTTVKKAPATKVAAKTPAVVAPAQAPAASPRTAAKRSAPQKKAAVAKKTATPDKAPAKQKTKSTQRLIDTLQKMGDQRPTKAKSLWRLVKSLLGADASDDDVEQAVGQLVSRGIVRVSSTTGVEYPPLASPLE